MQLREFVRAFFIDFFVARDITDKDYSEQWRPVMEASRRQKMLIRATMSSLFLTICGLVYAASKDRNIFSLPAVHPPITYPMFGNIVFIPLTVFVSLYFFYNWERFEISGDDFHPKNALLAADLVGTVIGVVYLLFGHTFTSAVCLFWTLALATFAVFLLILGLKALVTFVCRAILRSGFFLFLWKIIVSLYRFFAGYD